MGDLGSDLEAGVAGVVGAGLARELGAAAKANTFENFVILFAQKFMNIVLGRMDANAEIFQAILDDTGFADDLKSSDGRAMYREMRNPGSA